VGKGARIGCLEFLGRPLSIRTIVSLNYRLEHLNVAEMRTAPTDMQGRGGLSKETNTLFTLLSYFNLGGMYTFIFLLIAATAQMTTRVLGPS
jgi:hypothetical protein